MLNGPFPTLRYIPVKSHTNGEYRLNVYQDDSSPHPSDVGLIPYHIHWWGPVDKDAQNHHMFHNTAITYLCDLIDKMKLDGEIPHCVWIVPFKLKSTGQKLYRAAFRSCENDVPARDQMPEDACGCIVSTQKERESQKDVIKTGQKSPIDAPCEETMGDVAYYLTLWLNRGVRGVILEKKCPLCGEYFFTDEAANNMYDPSDSFLTSLATEMIERLVGEVDEGKSQISPLKDILNQLPDEDLIQICREGEASVIGDDALIRKVANGICEEKNVISGEAPLTATKVISIMASVASVLADRLLPHITVGEIRD